MIQLVNILYKYIRFLRFLSQVTDLPGKSSAGILKISSPETALVTSKHGSSQGGIPMGYVWQIYLSFGCFFWFSCRKMYQSHEWYGNEMMTLIFSFSYVSLLKYMLSAENLFLVEMEGFFVHTLPVGGFNPFEKYFRQIGNLPQFSGLEIKHIWVATS